MAIGPYDQTDVISGLESKAETNGNQNFSATRSYSYFRGSRQPLNSVKRSKLNKLLLSEDMYTDTVYVRIVKVCFAFAFDLLMVSRCLWSRGVSFSFS